MANVIFELSGRVKELLTLITLVSSSILVFAKRANTSYKSICQKQITILAIALSHFLLFDSICLLDIQKYLLGNFCMPLSTRPSENIKTNVEPLVDISVDLIIVIADLLRSFFLFHGLYFSSCPIFISTADV
jgi:hypothetical protein